MWTWCKPAPGTQGSHFQLMPMAFPSLQHNKTCLVLPWRSPLQVPEPNHRQMNTLIPEFYWRVSPIGCQQICWAQDTLQHSGQSNQNQAKGRDLEASWSLREPLYVYAVKARTGHKSSHTREILTCIMEFQNGTHQKDFQKSKELTSIQQQAPFSLQAAKQRLLSPWDADLSLVHSCRQP